ncbi:MAG: hypothetical protein HQ559_18045 [Lentisphaerae bacterium]|nr:hypothetical protein [Lentisphaerota bacterium]
MKDRSEFNDARSEEDTLDVPEIVTYEKNELMTRTALTEIADSGEFDSDRNAKENTQPVDPAQILDRLKRFTVPEVTTYHRDDLVVDTAFTGRTDSEDIRSDRNAKEHFRAIDKQEVLEKVAQLEEPHMTTYESDELIVETVFTGTDNESDVAVSDRHAKEHFVSVDVSRMLRCLVSSRV